VLAKVHSISDHKENQNMLKSNFDVKNYLTIKKNGVFFAICHCLKGLSKMMIMLSGQVGSQTPLFYLNSGFAKQFSSSI